MRYSSFDNSTYYLGSLLSDVKSSRWVSALLLSVCLILGAYFLAKDFRQESIIIVQRQKPKSDECKKNCRTPGTEPLPALIVHKTTNLRPHQISGSDLDTVKISRSPKNLLAIPVGIRQKNVVDQIVSKFLLCDFVVMLFHYDGIVDEWHNLAWSHRVIHVAALNQTKWWFAKRFLHPDVVADYDHIFLWDEDIGVENFSPKRYLSIIKTEGLEISQPALDPVKSRRVHHGITARSKKSQVHRRVYKFNGSGRCYDNSTAPPCTGWVELMVPVFSRKAWRCTWHMIQNDLIHAWGLDKKLGYCAQGDRMKNVGVVDSEYVVHFGLPTLGAPHGDKLSKQTGNVSSPAGLSLNSTTETQSQPVSPIAHFRSAVRERSYLDMKIFQERWRRAAKEDRCWVDPYRNSTNRPSVT